MRKIPFLIYCYSRVHIHGSSTAAYIRSKDLNLNLNSTIQVKYEHTSNTTDRRVQRANRALICYISVDLNLSTGRRGRRAANRLYRILLMPRYCWHRTDLPA
eukprot:SAG31_NODE_735_length_12488_cov_7.086044_10_plen_102_part_00